MKFSKYFLFLSSAFIWSSFKILCASKFSFVSLNNVNEADIFIFKISLSVFPCNFKTFSWSEILSSLSFDRSTAFCWSSKASFCSFETPLIAPFNLSKLAINNPTATTKAPIPVAIIAVFNPLNATLVVLMLPVNNFCVTPAILVAVLFIAVKTVLFFM